MKTIFTLALAALSFSSGYVWAADPGHGSAGHGTSIHSQSLIGISLAMETNERTVRVGIGRGTNGLYFIGHGGAGIRGGGTIGSWDWKTVSLNG